MTNKQLADKAIDIKGNQYVLVSDRILYFNEEYKNGAIKTALVSKANADMVVVKAQVIPNLENPDRYFTGYSQAKWGEGMVNKTSALENAETSAVGRALAMMGIGVIDSVASVDEMQKAGVSTNTQKTPQNRNGGQSDTIQFGKHKGRKWTEIPSDYLTWMVSSEKILPDTRELAVKELARRNNIEITDETIDPDEIDL